MLTPVPSFGFVVSRRGGWYPELPVADDPLVEDFDSLHIMGGHVFTDGSGGAETKDLVCSPRWEEELAYWMARINQWQEPNSSLQ